MYVKQIDIKTALQLAAKGKEVLVMLPAGKDSGWDDMMPDTLGHLLEGCLFFRREPAMEVELAESAEIEKAQPDPPPSRKEAWPEEGTGCREAGGAAQCRMAGGQDCGRAEGYRADSVRALAEDERGGQKP